MVKKLCFVPVCNNNSLNAPIKVFIHVPLQPEIRQLWCDTVGCTKSLKSQNIYCCEDHFNLIEDAENLIEHTLMTCRLRMKKGVVPTKFLTENCDNVDFTQVSLFNLESFKRKLPCNEDNDGPSTSKQSHLFEEEPRPSTPKQFSSSVENKLYNSPLLNRSIEKVDVGTPSSNDSETRNKVDVDTPSSNYSETFSKHSETSGTSLESAYGKEELKKISQNRINIVIESESRFYIGLPKDVYFIIKLASQHAKLNHTEILITLKKIRLNDPYLRLGVDFGVSSSFIGNVINKSIKPLALFFKNFVYWPSKQVVFKNLPLAFRRRYFKVNSIIDCFEVEIQKPSNSLHQALTWSSYKHTNTLKFLVSVTPCGLINFISEGFGGRISDVEIVKESGYLDVLPESSTVMSDRGFKNIDYILSKKKCILVRPPSVEVDKVLSKEEVLVGKRIASVRIHVERAISRVREFDLLKPNAHVDIHFIGKLNFAVTIACGIINLQPSLIKL